MLILIANERQNHCLPKIVLKINNVLWSLFYYNETGTPTIVITAAMVPI